MQVLTKSMKEYLYLTVKIALERRSLKKKASDFSEVGPEHFQFVKCVNRRVRVPDGKATYDCEGLKDLY